MNYNVCIISDICICCHKTDKNRLQILLDSLKRDSDEDQQLESLKELCNIITVSSEESLANCRVEQFIPHLIKFLNMEHQPDMMSMSFSIHQFETESFGCLHPSVCFIISLLTSFSC
jgi:hypothetical protein